MIGAPDQPREEATVVAICTSRDQLRLALPPDRRRAVVMTMGALHAGHAALIDAARDAVGADGHVTTTVFVNPLQFGPKEDLERYPRTPEADIELAAAHGCDVVYLPTVADVYGPPDAPLSRTGITVDPGPLGTLWEGAVRPGHFTGVLTVVMALLQQTEPDLAFFGEKDYQQLTLIRGMAARFTIRTSIVGVPTVRDEDGLALSSRNAYLSPSERALAAKIPAALSAGQRAAVLGADRAVVIETVQGMLDEAGLVADYVALTDPDLGESPLMGEARLLVAVPLGKTRLLDNVPVWLKGVA